jgi:Ca-activated chloride channel homolog
MPITRGQWGVVAIWLAGMFLIAGLGPRQSPGVVLISIVSGGNKEEWLHQAARTFNNASARQEQLQLNGKSIVVEVLQEVVDGRQSSGYRSGTAFTDIVDEKIKPTIFSPGEESWTLRLQQEWQAKHGKPVASELGPTLVRTPLVIATWQSSAEALGCWPTPQPDCSWERLRRLAISPEGWGLLGRPEWGKLKLGYAYVGEANTGTHGMAVMCMVGAGKVAGLVTTDVGMSTPCGEFMAEIERSKVHSGLRSDWMIEQMTAGGPSYLDALVTYERDVILANQRFRQTDRDPLVAGYPQDGTILLGHPYTILDGTPWVSRQQAEAALVFRSFLLSEKQQQLALAGGFRPGEQSIPLGLPIDPVLGVNPGSRLITVDLPSSEVMARIVEVWHQVKKRAVVTIVFDKSSTMAGAKLEAAKQGAQAFVRRMECEDRLLWLAFDHMVYPSMEGFRCNIGAELTERISGTPAGGGNALYDAILSGYEQLEANRAINGDSLRYGMVVLSDAQDSHSRTSLSDLIARLRHAQADPTGIQIHTIAIGNDADKAVLWSIANAAHGRFWEAQTARDMVAVYNHIATYY